MSSSSPDPAARNRKKRKKKQPENAFRLFHEPPTGIFPAKEELLKLLAVLAIATSVAVTCNYMHAAVSRRSTTPFCDTGDHQSDACEPCPQHGVCSDGDFICTRGYKKIGRRCAEDTEVKQTAKKFSNWLEHQICDAYARLMCGGKGKVWFQVDEILQMLQEHNQNENIGPKVETLAITKQMAIETLRPSFERRISLGIEEFKCPDYLAQLHKPLLCTFRQWIYGHILLSSFTFAMLVGSVILSWKVRQKQYLTSRAEELYEQICEILEENSPAGETSIQGEYWVVYSWLRDHLLLPSERKNARLWKKVEELVQEDSRIDQYPKLIKGESKVVLEWQVEGSLSGKMRRKGKASKMRLSNGNYKQFSCQVQKTLDGELMMN